MNLVSSSRSHLHIFPPVSHGLGIGLAVIGFSILFLSLSSRFSASRTPILHLGILLQKRPILHVISICLMLPNEKPNPHLISCNLMKRFQIVYTG